MHPPFDPGICTGPLASHPGYLRKLVRINGAFFFTMPLLLGEDRRHLESLPQADLLARRSAQVRLESHERLGAIDVSSGKLGHDHATCSNALYHEVTISVPEGREFVLSVEELIAVGGQFCDELRFGDRREGHAETVSVLGRIPEGAPETSAA